MRAKRAVPLLLASVLTLGSGSCFPACGCMFPETGRVLGTVRDASGAGVQHGVLQLRAVIESRTPTRTATSAADGTYAFRSTQVHGAYELTLTPPPGRVLAPGQVNPRPIDLDEEDVVEDFVVIPAP